MKLGELVPMLLRIPKADAHAIRLLSSQTRVPMSFYLREAIQDLLKKYNISGA